MVLFPKQFVGPLIDKKMQSDIFRTMVMIKVRYDNFYGFLLNIQ